VRLTEAQLRQQFDRATTSLKWIREAEDLLSVPPFLLHALGSRETNLGNVRSRDGHGWGYFQRDDRSFAIPEDYLLTPYRQGTDAATLLMAHYARFRVTHPQVAWRAAICAYNAGAGGVTRVLDAGRTPDSATTFADYGSDVLERWSYMARWGWNFL
jgi:hypothetical protein